MDNFWGEPISIYTDADAIEDGTLIDVSGCRISFNNKPINRVTDNAFHTLDFAKKQPATISNNLKFIAENSKKDREGADAWGIFEADKRLGNEKLWLVNNELDGYTLMLPGDY